MIAVKKGICLYDIHTEMGFESPICQTHKYTNSQIMHYMTFPFFISNGINVRSDLLPSSQELFSLMTIKQIQTYCYAMEKNKNNKKAFDTMQHCAALFCPRLLAL